MPRPAIIKALVTGLDDGDIEANIQRIASHEYDGVECGMHDAPETVATTLDRYDLEATDVMTGLNHVQEPESELLEFCETLGTNRAVLGYLDESYFDSPETVRETARLLNDCADTLADHGLEFCYHNHDHEFATFDDRTGMEILVEHLTDDVRLEVDVGWVGVGGVSPFEFIERHADRIPLIHLKDMDYETGESLPLGEGDLDVEGVVRAAEGANVDWLIYEHEQPEDKAWTVEHGAELLRDLLAENRGGDD
jgi:sugar phosphate isomerase/epimerase